MGLMAESNNWRRVIGTVNVTMCLFKAADNQKQLLNSWHSAAVGRQQSVGYELHNFCIGHLVLF